MRTAIITVAGIASRFNQDLEKEALKGIYYEKNPQDTILYRQLLQMKQCDKIVIVGGYLYQELQHYLKEECRDFLDKAVLLFNPYYKEYGSGYSFYLGLEEANKDCPNEIIFAEGDLYFDSESFIQLLSAKSDVITTTKEPIYSNKAVVVYIDELNKIKYLYNTLHGCLAIKEPFRAVFNSGQVWKFVETKRLFAILENMSQEKLQGTNLEIIQRYYEETDANKVEILNFQRWINCNTKSDYHKMLELMGRNRNEGAGR